MKIDYAKIAQQPTVAARKKTALEEIKRVDYVCMTDAMMETNRGGQFIMQLCGESEKETLLRGQVPRKYKIRAIKDEWGNLYYPGDVIKRRIEKPKRDIDGNKYTNRALKQMRTSGEYEEMFVYYNEYTVDEKGCIEAMFEDAGYFLGNYGVHYETNFAICGRKEFTRDPCKAPDGQKLHIHYWRFKEMPPEVYETLPRLERPTEPKKRGRKPKDEVKDISA
jgi:hypothetical protein